MILLGGPPAAAVAQRGTPAPAPDPTVIATGPGITGLGGLAVARDGQGGLVYLDGGHVFVSRLLGGSFQPAQQVDAGLSGTSSQPVIAASSGGLLTVAFVNGGNLYALQATSASGPLSAPQPLASGASNPALSMSTFGKAYLAFTTTGAGGSDVRVAYYDQGQWALEPSPLDANPGDGAGSGTGRPSVVAAGDGVGIVAWGEAGHVYARRVWGTQPDPLVQQMDVPSLGGWTEAGADEPAISAGGDSSYLAVAFRERFAAGSSTQTRVLVNHLTAEQVDGAVPVDGIPAMGGDSADQPQLAVNEYGRGWATSEDATTHNLFGAPLTTNDTPATAGQLNSLPSLTSPDAVPATAGIVSTFIAWEQDPGAAGPPDIRLRYAPDGVTLGAEQVLSVPAQGPADAAAGLSGAGDLAGDAAVAWVQGSGAQTSIVAAQLYQPPGGFSASSRFRYSRVVDPWVAWDPAPEPWGPLTYTVTVDGVPIGATTSTVARTPPLAQGPHTYLVTATNRAGESTADRPAIVFVDSIPPRAQVRLRGRRSPGSVLRLSVRATDTPPGLPRADASGVASIRVQWGDGSRARVHRGRARHVYRRRGRYTITVTVEDRAGNRAVIRLRLAIGRVAGGGGHARGHLVVGGPARGHQAGRHARRHQAVGGRSRAQIQFGGGPG